MGEHTAGRAGSVLAAFALAVAIGSIGVAGEVEPWMPETLPGFVRAVELGIAHSLTPRERAAFTGRTSEELRETDPELHDKIRRSFVTWTDRWVRRATRGLERVPEQRMQRAKQATADVDGHLRAYFAARGWDYRPLQVIFLPQHLMEEPDLLSVRARGMYVLYYPDVIFASLDAKATMRHTLIHESLHLNKTGPGLGRTLTEGIAEVAATQLALEWGMVRRRALREANSYPKELQAVNYVIDRMTERTEMGRERAVEILLHTYLTGDSTEVEAIFGTAAWSEVVHASRNLGKVRKTAKQLL